MTELICTRNGKPTFSETFTYNQQGRLKEKQKCGRLVTKYDYNEKVKIFLHSIHFHTCLATAHIFPNSIHMNSSIKLLTVGNLKYRSSSIHILLVAKDLLLPTRTPCSGSHIVIPGSKLLDARLTECTAFLRLMRVPPSPLFAASQYSISLLLSAKSISLLSSSSGLL